MKRQEKSFSTKKKIKTKGVTQAVDLETVCSRLNQIIERSNAIDEQISKYEQQQNKKNILSPITISTDSVSTFHQYSIKSQKKSVENTELYDFPKLTSNQTSQSKISSISKDGNSSINNSLVSPNQNNADDPLTLKTLYDLMLELKEQVKCIADNQKIMQKEIEKLSLQHSLQ